MRTEAVQPRIQLPEVSKDAIRGHYLEQLSRLYGRHIDGRNAADMTGQNKDGTISTALRIIIRPPTPDTRYGIISDLDDTQILTSANKRKFIDALIARQENTDRSLTDDQKERLKIALQAVNSAARMLQPHGGQPEVHSPLLELRGVTRVMQNIHAPDGFVPVNEAQARELLVDEIALVAYEGEPVPDWPSLRIRTRTIGNGGNAKKYFIAEHTDAAGFLYSGSRPEGVTQEVWDTYRHEMLNAAIPPDELKNHNLKSSQRLIFATLGDEPNQLDKSVQIITQLHDANETNPGLKLKLPDEIVIITSGSKQPILKQIVNETPQVAYAFLDDSVTELQDMLGVARVTPFRVKRPNTKREHHKTPPGVEELKDFPILLHSEILEKLQTAQAA